MRTLLPDPAPAEIEAVLERRRQIGADRHDEVWDGVLHMAPAAHGRHHLVQQQLAVLLDGPARAAGLLPAIGDFNLGQPDDYRVPDGALHRPGPDRLYYPTAALVVEIVSPGDASWEKLPFYAARHVDEVLIVDPQKRMVDWFSLEEGEYREIDHSRLIDLGQTELARRIDWPPVDP
jgi:Uma2 family endonuclease